MRRFSASFQAFRCGRRSPTISHISHTDRRDRRDAAPLLYLDRCICTDVFVFCILYSVFCILYSVYNRESRTDTQTIQARRLAVTQSRRQSATQTCSHAANPLPPPLPAGGSALAARRFASSTAHLPTQPTSPRSPPVHAAHQHHRPTVVMLRSQAGLPCRLLSLPTTATPPLPRSHHTAHHTHRHTHNTPPPPHSSSGSTLAAAGAEEAGGGVLTRACMRAQAGGAALRCSPRVTGYAIVIGYARKATSSSPPIAGRGNLGGAYSRNGGY